MLMFRCIADVVSNSKNFSKKFRKKFLSLVDTFPSMNDDNLSNADYINFLAMTQNVMEDYGHDVPVKFTDLFWDSVSRQPLRDWFIQGFMQCIHEGIPIVNVQENAKKKTEYYPIRWRDTEAVIEFITKTIPHYQDMGYKVIFNDGYSGGSCIYAYINHRIKCIVVN